MGLGILGMCRRLAVSLGSAWLQRAKGTKKHCRKSTRDFQNHLKAHGAAGAFALVTAGLPTTWLPDGNEPVVYRWETRLKKLLRPPEAWRFVTLLQFGL